MESYRKLLNKQQSELRRALLSFSQHDKAIQLFMGQHAMLHSAEMAQSGSWSLEDEILDDMTEEQVMDEGAVIDAARGLIDYWGRRTIAGLLLMPPTRHNIVHLNEALRLKRKRY